MGGAFSTLLPRSPPGGPKTTVTPTFRLSPNFLQPSKYLGMHQYHNFHDLGRNSPDNSPKLRRTPSTNYIFMPLNFEAVKIGFQLDPNLIIPHFATFPWLLMAESPTFMPSKPPWTYLIIHSKLISGKLRGNSCYKSTYKFWTLIWNFLHHRMICSTQPADLSCNYDHKSLIYLSAQFYKPYGGNFSPSICSCAILLVSRFANSPLNHLIFYKSNSCNRLLTDTWTSSTQTFCTQKGSLHSNCMQILHSSELHKPPWMLPKHLQIQSHISKSGDQITCINTAVSSAQVYHPYGGNFSNSACSHAILLKYRFATYPSTPFPSSKSNTCNRLLMDTWISSAQTLCTQKGSIHSNCMMILHYFEFLHTLLMLTKHQQTLSQISDLDDQSACITSADKISTQLSRTHQPIQEHCAYLSANDTTYFHDEGT